MKKSKISFKLFLFRKLVLLTAMSILLQAIFPGVSYALTSGPSQPEFSSFEPVTTTNMVNEFSGSFTYNLPLIEIPGPDGSSYPLSLSYHSGSNVETESSWVGYGWTLNPGAINRSKRGFADDSKNKVTYYNKVEKNVTASFGSSIGAEIYSFDFGQNAGIRYNNYKGFGYVAGLSLGIAKGIASLGYSYSDGTSHFSAKINPAKALSWATTDDRVSGEVYKQISKNVAGIDLIGSQYGIFSYAGIGRSTNSRDYKGTSFNFNTGFSLDAAFLHIGVQTGMSGNATWQENTESKDLQTQGYMYAGEGQSGNTMMDYYLEKEQAYIKQDKFLSIPFTNADNYMVTGEGLGGGFRLYNKRAGHFSPNEANSNTTIINAGLDVGVGQVLVEVGGSFAGGSQSLKVGKWEDLSTFAKPASEDEPYFLRFNNDLGGSVRFDNNSDIAKRARLEETNSTPFAKEVSPGIQSISPKMTEMTGDGVRSSRSSFIAYTTNKEIAGDKDANGKPYRLYGRDPELKRWVLHDSQIENGIGEIVTFNETGNRYVYGLPVYARNEMQMKYDLMTAGTKVVKNYLAYKNIDDIKKNETQVGEVDASPYATSYLLTEITTPDYVDLTDDGLTKDDFGGYTRFTYNMAYGTPGIDTDVNGKHMIGGSKATGDNWFKWRLPYTGLLYERNELSNNRDDLGSKTCGEKEIYYLATVETKTHIAYFVLDNTNITLPNGTVIKGSGIARNDGMEANFDFNAKTDIAAQDAGARGKKALHKLEKILLYAKDENSNAGSLIKTINFAYDYSICPNTPNNRNYDPTRPDIFQPNTGKLTLKKVWFDYQDIINAKVSPYFFSYEYKKTSALPDPVIKKYGSLFDEYGPQLIQNPIYSPFALDRWGYYQFKGELRHDILNPWVNQGLDAPEFDPAAWQLKSIRLPSGGEILIQYEQNDYSFVQNQAAMAMVSLIHNPNGLPDGDEQFFVNTNDLGISPAEEQKVAELAAVMNEEFITNRKKIYFKFLYALLKGELASLDNCTSDYITGYAHVKQVDIEKNTSGSFIKVTLDGELPKNVCDDFVKIEKVGNLNKGPCDPSGLQQGMGKFEESDVAQFVLKLGGFISTLGGNINACATIRNELSYLRIPVVNEKKGGGIRVKRLMMLDHGLEKEDAMLFGNEYIYKMWNKNSTALISSGVATTEPVKGREENAIINPIKRFDQSLVDKIIAGEDKKKTEGFLGESILPEASIGYARVITKNIHEGKTNPGFSVHEFFTCKDRPFISPDPVDNHDQMTGIEQNDELAILPLGIVNYSHSKMWLSQGFSFIANNMHGQTWRVWSCGGNPLQHDENWIVSSKQEYSYYEPGEKIPMVYGPGNIKMENPGKEMELTFESRSIEDEMNQLDLEMDFGIGYEPPVVVIPFASAGFSVTINKSALKTHTTSKIIRYPAIVKSISNTNEGAQSTVNYIGFDPATGNPVITSTDDEYDNLSINSSKHNGKYTQYTLPAYQQYKPMSQKSLNERYTLIARDKKVFITKDNGSENEDYLVFTGPGTCEALSMFSPGSFIRFQTTTGTDDFYYTDKQVGNRLLIYPSTKFNCSRAKGVVTQIEIVKSGYTNQLSVSAGDIQTYGSLQASALITQKLNSAELALRKSVVDQLNKIQSMTKVEIPGSKLPPGIFKTFNPITHSTTCGNIARIILERDDANDLLNIRVVYNNEHGLSCRESLITEGGPGKFEYDLNTGKLVYRSSNTPCFPIPVKCIEFCTDLDGHNYLANVVEANAKTMTDNWEYDFQMLPRSAIISHNPYELGQKGKWRLKSNYVYQTSIKDVESSRAYDAGVFKDDMALFDYQNEDNNDTTTWLRLNTIEKYSFNGNPIEEKDANYIRSAAKFGYHESLPYLVAANADYGSVLFESFENQYDIDGLKYFEDKMLYDGFYSGKGVIHKGFAHSGNGCLELKPGLISFPRQGFPLKIMKLSNQILSQGLSVKCWIKEPGEALIPPGKMTVNVYDDKNNTIIRAFREFKRIAKTGEWALYAVDIQQFGSLKAGDLFELRLNYAFSAVPEKIFIDDVRVQPLDAQVNCYVYDVATLKLVTSFDDQHLGLYYQYNAEGKLIRKLVETEKGTKTITETQYNTPKVKRQ